VHAAEDDSRRDRCDCEVRKQESLVESGLGASRAGFAVRFRYICVDNISTSVKRVKVRAFMGGHSGSEDRVRDIRSRSLSNLQCAFDELGKTIDLFDI
jgi:predicted ABC-type ATPase